MRSSDSFFTELCAENHDYHDQCLSHPVVLGIGAGTLTDEAFRYYIEQDYQFLLRYVRVLAHAVNQSPDLITATRFSELLHSTLTREIDALIELYESFGGERGNLDVGTPAPTCQAYTDHLLARASDGDLLVTIAAILPCQWGYREIGRHLLARGLPGERRYARWIQEYASEEYGILVDWLIERFDTLAAQAGETSREMARSAFALSTRYEHAFWEMAATREHWPSVELSRTG